jgi:hypothetical protein
MGYGIGGKVKFTDYFLSTRARPDRRFIQFDWIFYVLKNTEFEEIQEDGRIKLWARIQENDNRYLRVILLPDRQTVHNAFFDRRLPK